MKVHPKEEKGNVGLLQIGTILTVNLDKGRRKKERDNCQGDPQDKLCRPPPRMP